MRVFKIEDEKLIPNIRVEITEQDKSAILYSVALINDNSNIHYNHSVGSFLYNVDEFSSSRDHFKYSAAGRYFRCLKPYALLSFPFEGYEPVSAKEKFFLKYIYMTNSNSFYVEGAYKDGGKITYLVIWE